VAWWF